MMHQISTKVSVENKETDNNLHILNEASFSRRGFVNVKLIKCISFIFVTHKTYRFVTMFCLSLEV
jgi:hypothetical protein